jgi:hypothetical protein
VLVKNISGVKNMPNVLIISDSLNIPGLISTGFLAAGCTTQSMDVLKFIDNGNEVLKNSLCTLLFIDSDFIKRSASFIDEIDQKIKNCASRMPIYLIFEDDYDPCFSAWRLKARRLYESINQSKRVQEVVKEITKLESNMNSRYSYCSPMDSS